MDGIDFAAMEKKVRCSWLLAFYGPLLTGNQREMARLHWEEDLSLAEIAQQFSVSRQSVFDTVNRTEKQLEGLEEKLGMLRRFQAAEAGLKKIREELDALSVDEAGRAHIAAARRIIDSLLDQEEE